MKKILNQVDKSVNYNKFFYQLKDIPYIKNYISDYVYDKYEKKTFFLFSPHVVKNIKNIVTKSLYLGFLGLIPLALNEFIFDAPNPIAAQKVFFYIWFLLLYVGTMQYSNSMTADSIKTFLISFKLNFKDYHKHHLKMIIYDRLIYMLVFAFGMWIFDVSLVTVLLALSAILLIVVYTNGKDINYSFKWYYAKPHMRKQIEKNIFDVFFIILFMIFGIYNTNVSLAIANLYFLYFILYYYNKYRKIDFYEEYHRVFLIKFKEYDYNLNQTNTDLERVKIKNKNTLKHSEFNIDDYYGYDLFNRIFVDRMSFLWRKTYIYSQLILALILALVYLLMIISSDIRVIIVNQDIHSRLLNIYVFFLYVSNLGKVLTQAYYYNADYSLLHYPFYFNEDNLWKQFIVRLKTVFEIQLKIAATLIFFTSLVTITFPVNFTWETQIKFTLFIIGLLMFVSIIDLALYYLLQPFNKKLESQSKIYSIVHGIIYFGLYMTELNVNSLVELIIVSSISLIAFGLSLILVKRIGHKTFKYKD